jgi:hypothetical protein
VILHTFLRLLTPLCLALPLAVVGHAQEKPGTSQPPPAEKLKGPVAPDIKQEAVWDARKIMPFKAIDDPKMVAAKEADFLDDSDYVLGVSEGGASKAYPTRYVWFHHIVNDTIGKPGHEIPIAVTYCSVCNTGIRYNTQSRSKTLKLDFFGLYNGVVCLCERESEGVFLQVDGRIVNGPLLGTRLKFGSLLDTTWGNWKRLHPETVVMSPDTPFQKFYSPKGKPEMRGHLAFPRPYFQPTVTHTDRRLPPFEKVLAVTLTEEGKAEADALHRAYPIAALQAARNAVNDRLGALPVAVLLEPDTMTASALVRALDGKTLTFEARNREGGTVAFYDKETGTRWSIEGLGLEGPLAGKTLRQLDNHLSQWYGWAAYFPETTIFGNAAPPQPGDPRTDFK